MENNWVDFKAVKAAVSITAVLQHYQVALKKSTGGEFRGPCPIHQSKTRGDSFHVSPEKNAFQCFTCDAKGNVLDFVAAMEQCSVRDAALKLQDWFGLAGGPLAQPSRPTPRLHSGARQRADKDTRPSQRSAPATGPELAPEKRAGDGVGTIINPPLKFQLKGVDCSHPYLAGRGISRETAEAFGVGFFPGKGSMVGRVVIPIHNESGELVAYAGRAIDGSEPRYKVPAGFHKGGLLFNLHRVAGQACEVIVVEGFFDCMKVHQAGFACVALMGCSLSEEQEALLCRQFSAAVLLLDGDEPGQRATDELLVRLGRKMWARAVQLAPGVQPDQLGSEDLARLLEK